MVDIQSAAAEIRRGKKKDRRKKERKKPHGKNIMACPITAIISKIDNKSGW